MDSFIKKIFKENVDDLVHFQFIKFSKGTFEDRAMIRAKNSSEKFTIATTYEYAKELIITLAEKLGENKTQVTGALISALDLDFDYDERKMAMGVRKYMLNREMTGKQILELCNKIDKAFFALSFNVGETELIISPKSPKSAKGASSSKKEGAKAKINFIIEDIIMPETDEKDFAKIRELAKRKGKIIRELDIDGKIIKKDIEFEA
jgi:hypothetical protein